MAQYVQPPSHNRVASAFTVLAGLIVSFGACQLACADHLQSEEPGAHASPPNVIFDTDMYSDIDDMLALAMLHALHDRHEINLVAVTVSTDEKWCASYVDLVDTFYRHLQIPVGIVHGGLAVEQFLRRFPPTREWPEPDYTRRISQRINQDGSMMSPHRLIDGAQAPDAASLLRKTLAAQPDGSVVMIEVGYNTNLARLLDSKSDSSSQLEGRELIRKKARLLSIMAQDRSSTAA
jgi:purine nucleosidase